MTGRPLDRATGEALPPCADPVAGALPPGRLPPTVDGSAAWPSSPAPAPAVLLHGPKARGGRSWSAQAIRRQLATLRLPAVVLAAAGLTLAGSGTAPMAGASTVGTPGGMCWTATSPVAGARVTLAACDPQHNPAQLWVFHIDTTGTATLGEFEASGTGLWAVPGPHGMRLGKTPVQFAYVNHRLATGGLWLAHPSGQLRLVTGSRNGKWFVFTPATAGSRSALPGR